MALPEHRPATSPPSWAALGVWGGLLLIAGCATRGDVDRIQGQLRASEARIETALVEFESGLVEAEEVTGAIRTAWGENKTEVAAVARDVQNRPGLWSRYALEIILAAVAASVPSAAGLTNVMRNRARRKRGEPVAVPKRTRVVKPAPRMGAE